MREKLLDRVFCAAFLLAQVAGWLHWAAAGTELLPWWGWPALLLASWLAADAASGIAHYAADNWGSPTTPLLGRTFIQPFRRHHHHPTELLEHDPFELNGNNCFLAALSVAWIPWIEVGPVTGFCMVFFLLLSLWASLTNQIHAWAHQTQSPRVVRWLQAAGILLSSKQHAKHHAHFVSSDPRPSTQTSRDGRAAAYCITSGVWDRVGAALWARARPARVQGPCPRVQPLSSR